MNDPLYKIKFNAILVLILLAYPISKSVAQENTIGVTNIEWDVSDGFTIFSADTKTYIVNNCGQVINEWESQNRISYSTHVRQGL